MIEDKLVILQTDYCGGVSLEYLMRNGYDGKIVRVKWEQNEEINEQRNL